MPQTKLNPDDELRFQNWYKVWAIKAGIDPNPDNPLHKYDYRAAYKAKVVPTIDPSDNVVLQRHTDSDHGRCESEVSESDFLNSPYDPAIHMEPSDD